MGQPVYILLKEMIFIGRRIILFEETSFSHSFFSPFYMLEFKSFTIQGMMLLRQHDTYDFEIIHLLTCSVQFSH